MSKPQQSNGVQESECPPIYKGLTWQLKERVGNWFAVWRIQSAHRVQAIRKRAGELYYRTGA